MRTGFGTWAAGSVAVIAALLWWLNTGNDLPPADDGAGRGAAVTSPKDGPAPPGEPRRPDDAPPPTTGGGAPTAARALMLFCAAGVMPPVQDAVAEYRRETGVEVQLQAGSSGGLLASIEAAGKGDLFIAGDADFTDAAHRKGLVVERLPLAVMRPVIAVRKGNPKGVTGPASLAAAGIKVGLGNPDGSAVGRVSRALLAKAGVWDAVRTAVQERGVFKPEVPQLANDLKLGTIDAAIIFDAVAVRYPGLEVVALPEDLSPPVDITLGVLRSAAAPARALHLARWLAARDRGLTHFRRHRYVPVEGDPWADRPRLKLLSGNILRPAVETTLREFEAREGVDVLVNFAGCGTLVSQLKAGERTDAYFACETSFLTMVADRFGPGIEVSRTEVVLVVRPGNPKRIRSLADLATAGLKVGLADERFSALGAVTGRVLREAGVEAAIAGNVVSRVPTADLLITQMKAGTLDAAVVYAVNARRVPDAVEVIPLPGAPVAVQPLAVSRDSRFPMLAGRLVDALTGARSRGRFLAGGFDLVDGR